MIVRVWLTTLILLTAGRPALAFNERDNAQAPVAPQPEVTVVVTGPETGFIGEPLTLQITVRNCGVRALHAVSLATSQIEFLSSADREKLQQDLGTLAAGQSRIISLSMRLRRAGEIRGQIRVTADGLAAVVCEVRLPVAAVRLSVTAQGPRKCFLDWPCTYSFTVKNESATEARQVSFALFLPRGVGFLRASQEGVYDPDRQRVVWTFAQLAAGESRTVVLKGIALTEGSQNGRIRLQIDRALYRQLSWSTEVIAAPNCPAKPEPSPQRRDYSHSSAPPQ